MKVSDPKLEEQGHALEPRAAARAPIGLLAGAGRFPLSVARKCREVGLPVIGIGLVGMADPSLADDCHRFHWCAVGRLGKMIKLMRRAGVREWMMAGKVQKSRAVHSRHRFFASWPDLRMIRMWWRLPDTRDDTILGSIVREFAADGLVCRSALDLCPELLVKQGVLTRRPPTEAEMRDIEFGWGLAKEMGRLDVGQSVAVRERCILAVEAIEGTDRAIARAGELCPRGGFTVVKVAKPQQDMRYDVPTVGTATIETMHAAGAKVLAIEADKTILLDAAETVAMADRFGMTVVAR